MFGNYIDTKELMTVYFLIIVLLLIVNMIIGLMVVFKSAQNENKIQLNSTSVSGKENNAKDRG